MGILGRQFGKLTAYPRRLMLGIGLLDPRAFHCNIGVLQRHCLLGLVFLQLLALGSGEKVEIVALGLLGVLGEIPAALEQELEAPRRHIVVGIAEPVGIGLELHETGIGLQQQGEDPRVRVRRCRLPDLQERGRCRGVPEQDHPLLARGRILARLQHRLDRVDQNFLPELGQIRLGSGNSSVELRDGLRDLRGIAAERSELGDGALVARPGFHPIVAHESRRRWGRRGQGGDRRLGLVFGIALLDQALREKQADEPQLDGLVHNELVRGGARSDIGEHPIELAEGGLVALTVPFQLGSRERHENRHEHDHEVVELLMDEIKVIPKFNVVGARAGVVDPDGDDVLQNLGRARIEPAWRWQHDPFRNIGR